MIGVLFLMLVPAADPPKPIFPLGKETTYVSGPLDKDGYIDYEAAINERLSKGVSPENNANVLIWKAIGPRPEGIRSLPEYFEALGMEEPPDRGDYFVGLDTYVKVRLKLDKSEADAISEQRSQAGVRPWAAKDFPHIATWLATNEKPLALVIEATKRPMYFNPMIVSREEGRRGPLIGALLHSVQKCREIVAALTARAMLRIGRGEFDDAWADLLACHRLGRLVSLGGTLIELLVGIAIDQIANTRMLVYVERAPLTGRQLLDRLNEQRNLPNLVSIAEKVDLGERFLALDALGLVRRDGPGILEALGSNKVPKPTAADLKSVQLMAKLDWDPALRRVNQSYDRAVSILRIQDRPTRDKEMQKLNDDLVTLASKPSVLKNRPTGESIGTTVSCLFMPAVQKLQTAQDRQDQTRQNLYVAFALAAYRRDAGRYPPKLDDLAPKYLATIPGDLYSGKPLIYRPAKNGYLLYSVGPNGKDDGGRFYDDDPPGDDLGVRMPLPELKPQK